jgi:integrase
MERGSKSLRRPVAAGHSQRWTGAWRGVERLGGMERGRASRRRAGSGEFRGTDLRRTCAKLCRSRGGDLEQIKFLLGHSSIQTTERYLGSSQDLERAVNDDLGIE